jgi:hypothetical protein
MLPRAEASSYARLCSGSRGIGRAWPHARADAVTQLDETRNPMWNVFGHNGRSGAGQPLPDTRDAIAHRVARAQEPLRVRQHLTIAMRESRPIARGPGRTAGSMRYLSGGAVRTLTAFGPSSDFGQSHKICPGPDSGWQG